MRDTNCRPSRRLLLSSGQCRTAASDRKGDDVDRRSADGRRPNGALRGDDAAAAAAQVAVRQPGTVFQPQPQPQAARRPSDIFPELYVRVYEEMPSKNRWKMPRDGRTTRIRRTTDVIFVPIGYRMLRMMKNGSVRSNGNVVGFGWPRSVFCRSRVDGAPWERRGSSKQDAGNPAACKAETTMTTTRTSTRTTGGERRKAVNATYSSLLELQKLSEQINGCSSLIFDPVLILFIIS